MALAVLCMRDEGRLIVAVVVVVVVAVVELAEVALLMATLEAPALGLV